MKVLSLPIQTIVYFNKQGEPKPIKFKITSENPPVKINVDKILYKRNERMDFI